MKNILPFHKKDAEAHQSASYEESRLKHKGEQLKHKAERLKHKEKRLKRFAFVPNWVRNEFIAWMGEHISNCQRCFKPEIL